MDAKRDVIEQEMEIVKGQLTKLFGIECSLKNLTQNFEMIRQSMEETQKSLQSLLMAQIKETSLPNKGGPNPMVDKAAQKGGNRSHR